MEIKTNLQQLAKTLATKMNMTQKDAEAFLREFFDTIIQSVTTDKLVKVKGLGTFKLIEVLDRESVNINTGERIVIPGHTRLSFTPDSTLRDAVNKPFADFQTVIINEGTSLEDMERIDQEEDAPLPDTEDFVEDEAGEEMEPEPVAEPEPEPVAEPEPESVAEPIAKLIAEPEQKPIAEPEPEPIAEPVLKPEPERTRGRALTGAETCALTLGIILLCVLSYLAGHNRLLDFPKVQHKKETRTEQPAKPKQEPTPTAAEKDTTATAAPETQVATQPEPAPEEPALAQVPGGKYRIVGTRKTHVMKPGDYLTRMALQEYGDKDFARYIIVHNNIKNPDNVPVGMTIKLPELEEMK